MGPALARGPISALILISAVAQAEMEERTLHPLGTDGPLRNSCPSIKPFHAFGKFLLDKVNIICRTT